jgi:putative membrane-bound dehydrogenase-like protein
MMKRILSSIACFCIFPIGAFGGDAGLGTLSVPEGFEITTAAAPGLTAYPMFMAFDDMGRLYIAESTGKDLSGKEMAAAPECQILRLVDSDGNGIYDTRTVFATELSLPMGVLWHNGALFVASPPDFLRFDDTNNDGVADKRTVLLTGWNVLNTASLHGPFLGPDGWLYLTHGRHGYKIQTKEGPVLEGMAARIWRCRPDGTGLERFAGGGFDNPVELVFTRAGQMLGTMTYFTDPRHGQRDALMHWVWGGVYPKPHEVTGEFLQTGPLLPTMTKFARIAPAGFLQYQGGAFGDEYRGQLFSAQFNPHRVQFHRLTDMGSTFATEDSDFLTSTSPDFYPTDIVQDADGSLLVCDTGAWYVDACPISRIAKPEIKGSIYRIRKTGAPQPNDPWGHALDMGTQPPAALIEMLLDERVRIRDRAREELVRRGGPALAAVRDALTHADHAVRREAVWLLYRMDGASAAGAIRSALADSAINTRIAAMQALGQLHDAAAAGDITQRLTSESPLERREAATALGRVGDPSATRALLAAAGRAGDRFEQHALTYALIELNDRATLLAAATGMGEWPARAAALIALDQLKDTSLMAAHAVPFLKSESPAARQAGLWVASHHPEWSATVLASVEGLLDEVATNENAAAMAREVLMAYASTGDGQNFISDHLVNPQTNTDTRLFLMDIVATAPFAGLPARWNEALGTCLEDMDAAIRWRALEISRNRRIGELSGKLMGIADDREQPANFRVAALGALVGQDTPLAGDRLELVLKNMMAAGDPGTRQTAASILGKAKLDAESKRVLAEGYLPSADALVLTAALQAFSGESDPVLGAALAEGLTQNPRAADLMTAAQLDRVLQPFPADVQARAAGLKARLEQRDAGLMERFLRLEPKLGAGDVGRGRAIFFGEKAACATCHAIGAEGGVLGPDLTTIGVVRSGHDLLEAVMFPNASIVPDFQPYTVEAGSEVLSGIVSRESADTITLRTAATETRTISRADIASITPTPVSMMPEGLDSGFSDEELLDLIAFLRSLNNEEWLLPGTRN